MPCQLIWAQESWHQLAIQFPTSPDLHTLHFRTESSPTLQILSGTIGAQVPDKPGPPNAPIPQVTPPNSVIHWVDFPCHVCYCYSKQIWMMWNQKSLETTEDSTECGKRCQLRQTWLHLFPAMVAFWNFPITHLDSNLWAFPLLSSSS